MEKSDLQPGMHVRNKISGRVGELRGREGKLLHRSSWCVAIRSRTVSGKHKGRWDYDSWDLKNLEMVSG
jgi:hypothetical protein